jgi:hypothetical protein
MRGGVAIGTAINLYDTEVYGPALVDAYRLESKVEETADYGTKTCGAASI